LSQEKLKKILFFNPQNFNVKQQKSHTNFLFLQIVHLTLYSQNNQPQQKTHILTKKTNNAFQRRDIKVIDKKKN
jgi:hypothetical protein